MAVTADLTYGGVPFEGIEFRVLSAHLNWEGGPGVELVYGCKVALPDGTAAELADWKRVEAEADTEEGHGLPQEQAEAHMTARLEAMGATNIQTVEE